MTLDEMDGEDLGGGNFLSQIPVIIWQRKWLLFIPLLLAIIGGIAAYFILPTVYRSEAVLLVQSSQLPQDVAGDGSAEIVDRRIARIRQQVLSRPGLIELINKHQLYRSERENEALSTVIEDMRGAIAIQAMSAEIQQRGSNKSSTIAFNLSFDYSDAAKAQSVAQDLTEQVLQLDSSVNSQQASSTEQFLTDQASGLQMQIGQLETQIATIKAQNGFALSNSGGITMLGGSGGSYDVQISALQRENSQLVTQRETALGSAKRDPAIANAESQLAGAKAIYSDDHPDVILAKQRLAEARELAKSNVQKLPVENIDAQLAYNNTQIAALRAAKAQERARYSAALNAQAKAPVVLQRIAQLETRLQGLNEQYQTVSNRLLAAQAGVKAEDEQMGERLSVIDPPIIPDEPVSPDALLIAGGSLAGGLGLGFLLVFGLEFFLQPIRDPKTIAQATGAAPMVVIPTIKPDIEDDEPRRFRWPFRRRTAEAD